MAYKYISIFFVVVTPTGFILRILRKDLLKHYSELNDLRYILHKKFEDNIEYYDKENLINEINDIEI